MSYWLYNIAPYDPFKTFKYSGPLRAVYPLSPRREVPAEIAKPDYSETGNFNICVFYIVFFNRLLFCIIGISKSEYMARSSDIKVCNAEEIEAIKKACTVNIEI